MMVELRSRYFDVSVDEIDAELEAFRRGVWYLDFNLYSCYDFSERDLLMISMNFLI